MSPTASARKRPAEQGPELPSSSRLEDLSRHSAIAPIKQRSGCKLLCQLGLTAGVIAFLCQSARAQHCGTLGQVSVCREDCGSCGAAPCCTLEWEFQGTTPEQFAQLVLDLVNSGGSDGLYELKGHVPSYEAWSIDIEDDDPKKIQIKHMPPEFAADDFALSQERWDEITLSIYPVPPSSSRVIAFSETRRHSAVFQCDGGSNYAGLFSLVSAIRQIPSYRERTLYGCREKNFGIIPQRAIELARAEAA